MKLLFTLFLAIVSANIPADISMLGVKINATKNVLDNIKLKIDSQDGNMIKYKTESGNDFSVTSDKGKIVYMENDWMHNQGAVKPLYSDFVFGQTSLKDIRKKFETNGFTYKTRGPFTTDSNLIEFNCFEFDSPNNEVLVAVTRISLTANVTEENVAEQLKLDAIIIASKDYLDKSWGKKKVFDSNYKKVKP